MPDISIFFLPTPSWLDPEPALRSVLESEFRDWELWVPETLASASWLQDPRVRTWPFPVAEAAELSLQALMAQCVERAAGRYLAWIESRHRWSRSKLGTQYAAIEVDPLAAIAWSGVMGAVSSPERLRELPDDALPAADDLAMQLAGVDVLDGWSNALVRREACEAALKSDATRSELPIALETLPHVGGDWFGAIAAASSTSETGALDTAGISTAGIAIETPDIEAIARLMAPRTWESWQTRIALAEQLQTRQFDRLSAMGATIYDDWRTKARSNRLKLQVADALDWLYSLGKPGLSHSSSSAPDRLAIAAIEKISADLHGALRQLRAMPDARALAELHAETIRAIALHDPSAANLDFSLRPPNPADRWRASLELNPHPTVSIGIPVYNGEATIAATIESVLAQTHFDFELLVIDDGSSDRTAAIVSQFDDPRLRLLRFENAGLAASRNRAIAAARADYVSFVDADDLWTPDKLADQLQALRNAPRAAAAYSFTDYIDHAGEFVRSGSHITVTGDALGHLLLTDFMENGSNVLVRRMACQLVGGFDESLPAAEDWDFLLKLAARHPFVCVPKPQILYRLTESAMSFDLDRQERACRAVLDRAFASVPEPFRQLESQSHSNLYQYLAYRALEAEPTAENRQSALHFLRKAIAVMPYAKLHADRCADFLAVCELYANGGELPPEFAPDFVPEDLFELTNSSPYPLVSVIIPAYNAAETIVETIESVRAQTLHDWEIVLIDDGSKDNTAEVVEAIGDPRVKVYRYPNAGQGESRNRGACHATGEFFAFLDADDLWTPDKLERMVKAIGAESEKTTVAYSWVDWMSEDGRELTLGCAYTRQGFIYDKLLLSDFIAGGSNLMVWRGAFATVGGFNPEFPPAEDRDMWLRLSEKFHFVAIESPLLQYRQVAQSQSANVTRMEKSQRKVIEAAFDRAPENFPFTELPELLPYYKRQVYANTYKYLVFKQLDAPVDRAAARIALRLYRVVLDNEPTLMKHHRRFATKLWLRIWLATWLPPSVMAKIGKRLRTFPVVHNHLLGYTRMSVRDLLPEPLRQRYAELTDGGVENISGVNHG